MEAFIQSVIERILDIINDKIRQKFEQLRKKQRLEPPTMASAPAWMSLLIWSLANANT